MEKSGVRATSRRNYISNKKSIQVKRQALEIRISLPMIQLLKSFGKVPILMHQKSSGNEKKRSNPTTRPIKE